MASRLAWLGLAALLAFFLALKSFALGPALSDENGYFYQAVLMTRGAWPYRDFFFAHPPLHLVPGWLLFGVTGFDLALGKLLPVLATAVSGAALFALGRRAAGGLAGLVAAASFLLCYDVLRASSHWTGINLSVAWMCAGLLAAWCRRPVAGGALFALGAATGFYVFPGALLTGVLLGVRERRAALRFAIGFVLPFAAVSLLFWAAGGQGYLDGVYRYHLLKPEREGAGLLDQLPAMLFHDFLPLAAPLYLLPGLWGSAVRRGERGLHVQLGVAAVLFAAGYLFFLALQARVFAFYFLLLLPACALCAGLFADQLWRAAAARDWGWLGTGVAALLAGLLVQQDFERQLGYWERWRGTTRSYAFPTSPLPAFANDAVRRLLWQPERTIGDRYTSVQYYLWHESRTFDEAADMAATLRDRAAPGDTLFGDAAAAPLVALLAGVPLAANQVDTNAMRFESGITPAEEVIRTLEADPPAWVLLSPGRGFHSLDAFRRWAAAHYAPVETWRTRHHGEYRLLRRR